MDIEIRDKFNKYVNNDAPKQLERLFDGLDENDGIMLQSCFEDFAKSILEQRQETRPHETIVMWRKPDEELPFDGQEVLFVKGNHTIKGYFSKPRSFFGPSGYNVNGVNGDHQIDKWLPVSELL